MKNHHLFILIAGLFFSACEPQQDDKLTLPPPPASAAFTIETTSNPNRFLLKSTTPDVFQYAWDIGNGNTANGATAEAFYPVKGDYEITLTVFGAGGSASSSQTINIPADAPFECAGNALYEFLSDCTERVWKLKPSAGALWVGPIGGGTTWWANSDADVTARFCSFDDEWTFKGDGKMVFDTKGDLWGEDYMGFSFECADEAMLSGAQAAWGSGTHAYLLTEGNPNQLTLNGLGAYLGLPKVANGSEVTQPVSSITYHIIRMNTNGNSREMELEVNFGGGLWRFIYISQ